MSNQEEHDRQQQPPYIDPGLLINTRLSEVERQQREDRAEEKKHKSDQLKINKSIAIFTGLLFVTSVLSDCLLFYQSSLNKESAKAAKSAADTAAASLDLTKRQMIATLAARMKFASDLTEGGGVRIVGMGTNNTTGSMPATDVAATVSANIKGWPDKAVLVSFPSKIVTARMVTPHEGEGGQMNEVVFGGPSAEIWNRIVSGRAFLEVNWSASYNDGFGNIVSAAPTSDCFIRLAPLDCPLFKGGFGGQWPCVQIDVAMRQAIADKEEKQKRYCALK